MSPTLATVGVLVLARLVALSISAEARSRWLRSQAFTAYPNGSVAYPAAGTSTTSIRMARVLPLA